MRFVLAVALLSATLAAREPPGVTLHTQARAMQPGEVVVVTATTSMPVDALEVSVFDRTFSSYRIDASTWQALIGIDLDVPPGPHVMSIVAAGAAGTATARRTLDVRAKAFRTRRLTVAPEYVEPPDDVTRRIVREAATLTAIWNRPSPGRLWDGAFAPPVPDAPNSAFGSRSVFNGQPRSPHGGADFASPAGRVVRAPNGGRVVLAADLYFTGRSVVVDHGLGLVSLFAHLSSIDVAEGDAVRQGDRLGTVGATGRVTGPHLHWTVRLAGTRVDPLSLMEVTGMPAPRAEPGP